MNVDYLIKETARNLRRNLTLTLASVLTVAVSLSLLGVALLLQKGVNNATDRWENGVEFIIWFSLISPRIKRTYFKLIWITQLGFPLTVT